jgi:anti-anti-sigma factor
MTTLVEGSESVLVQLAGRLDLATGGALRNHLNKVIPEQHRVCVLDMAHVDFIDSDGIGALVQELKRFRQTPCRLLVCNLRPAARLIFEITQLDQVFEIFDSYSDLLTSHAHHHELHQITQRLPVNLIAS